ncbi:MAG: hypothetical protein ACO1SV_09095 [Fimbriimonas sp.]
MAFSALGLALFLALPTSATPEGQTGIVDFLRATTGDPERSNPRALEDAIRQGADLGQLDARGNNAIHIAISNGHLPYIPRLLALGVSTRHRNVFGQSPWDWITRRTALLSPETEWGTAQATLGLAREFEAGSERHLLRKHEAFEAFVVAYLRPWDLAGRLQALAVLRKAGVPARIVAYDDGFPGESPGDVWLCVLRPDAQRARRALTQAPSLKGQLSVRRFDARVSLRGGGFRPVDESGDANRFHPGIDEDGFVPPSPPLLRRLRSPVGTTLKGIAPWLVPDLKTLRVRPRRHWDPEGGKMASCYDLRVVVTRRDAPEFRPVYRSQFLPGGHFTRWIRQSGPSPW